jgi:hypothetical protein
MPIIAAHKTIFSRQDNRNFLILLPCAIPQTGENPEFRTITVRHAAVAEQQGGAAIEPCDILL